MRMVLAALMMLIAGSALAQHQHAPSPYAELQQRPVKSLSEQQISDLRAGRGMGLALAAELNGYPGPIHVLELAERLRLSGEQRQGFHRLYEAMRSEAVPLGERLIEQERALDREFVERKVTPASVAARTEEIGETQAALRAVHLKYHLTTAGLLTGDQLRMYAELRGYR
jgi:hypothetical protein